MNINLTETPAITSPDTIFEVLKALLKDRDETDIEKEFFYVIGLNTSNRIKFIEIISIGTINSTLVHPREVFRVSIIKSATSIILAHNHPSGNTSPSENDIKITRKLTDAGLIIGINVTDHIIFTDQKYLSFKEQYLI